MQKESGGDGKSRKRASGTGAGKPPRKAPSRRSSRTLVARTFPIVGVGASAGGLEAFASLLESLPADTGMAFVLIQHLDPTHKTILPEILVPQHRDAGGAGHRRDGARARPLVRRSARPGHGGLPRPRQPDGAPVGGRHAPPRRPLPPFARARPALARHRRRPFRVGLRRGPRPGGRQGRGRHHLRAGPVIGALRRHADLGHPRQRRGHGPRAGGRSPQSWSASAGTPTYSRTKRRRRRPRSRRPTPTG